METTCRRNLKLKRMGKLEKEQIPDGKETIHIKKREKHAVEAHPSFLTKHHL